MTTALIEDILNVNQFVRMPPASFLSGDGIETVKRECGFPEDWSYIDVGTWLGDYDYIPFSRRRIPREDQLRVILYYITTHYDNMDAQPDIVWLNLPVHAFHSEMLTEISRLLVGLDFNITDRSHWIRYLLLGAPDRIRIGVRRYNENNN